MGDRKSNSFPVRFLGLDEITRDETLQGRLATSVDHQKMISEALIRGDIPAPVVVFWDDDRYWLADGYHRYGAYKSLFRSLGQEGRRFANIRAEIHEGDKRAAYIYAAGANKLTLLPRTAADIRKQVRMLVKDEECRNWPAIDMANHVGTTVQTVKKHFLEYCEEVGLEPPPVVTLKRGNRKRFNDKRSGRLTPPAAADGAPENNRLCHVTVNPRYTLLTNDSLRKFLTDQGVFAASLDEDRESLIKLGVAGISGLLVRGCVVSVENFTEKSALPNAVGRVLMAKAHVGKQWLRAVIVCPNYSQGLNRINRFTKQAIQFLGVELLSLDDFLDSVNGRRMPGA